MLKELSAYLYIPLKSMKWSAKIFRVWSSTISCSEDSPSWTILPFALNLDSNSLTFLCVWIDELTHEWTECSRHRWPFTLGRFLTWNLAFLAIYLLLETILETERNGAPKSSHFLPNLQAGTKNVRDSWRLARQLDIFDY